MAMAMAIFVIVRISTGSAGSPATGNDENAPPFTKVFVKNFLYKKLFCTIFFCTKNFL